jgi:hypothetical protein
MKAVSSIAVVGVAAGVIVAFWWASREGADAPDSEPLGPEAVSPARDAAAVTAAQDEAASRVTGQLYEIDAEQSEVYWRIYRAGPMARFGHSHVISAGEISGSITLAAELSDSSWELRIPVEGLIVDEPELRARYGEEFESVPGDEDKAGTKTNMLSEDVLNGEVYSEIRLSGQGFSGTMAEASLPVAIGILGRTIAQSFPATITVGEDSVTVIGEYRLSHADLGMEPFSIFGGAVSVGDDIDLTWRIHAIAVDQ